MILDFAQLQKTAQGEKPKAPSLENFVAGDIYVI